MALSTPQGVARSTASAEGWGVEEESRAGRREAEQGEELLAETGSDLGSRSLKLGQRELTRRLEGLERLCKQEREARLELEAELREHRQLIKQSQAVAEREREEAATLRSIVGAVETTAGELARLVPALRADVDEQRESHEQFAEALMEAVEEGVNKETLVVEQEKVAAKMKEYWDRELGATASQAELQENRKLLDEQLQRGMQALLMHVEQVGSDFVGEVERLEDKTKAVQANAQRLERNLEKVTGTLAGRVQESEEKIFLKLGPMSETVERYRQRRPSAAVRSIAGSL